MLVVADLLGVPEEDHAKFRTELVRPRGGGVGATDGESMAHHPLEFLYQQFADYVEDRRANPTDDVLSGLANATFPDGSLPEVIDVVRIAVNVFAAGQETTVRLFVHFAQADGRRSRPPAAAPRRTGADPELRRGVSALGEPGEG